MKKIISTLLVSVLSLGLLAGCQGDAGTSENTDAQTTEQTTQNTSEGTEEITLKLFSNLPDRNNGQGLV